MRGKTEQAALYSSLASIGQGLANPHRLKIISLLSHGEKTVDRLATAIGQSMAATSAHLKVLRAAGLVVAEKRGRNVHCRLAGDRVEGVWIALRELGQAILPEAREIMRTTFEDPEALSPLDERAVWAEVQDGKGVLVDLRPDDEFEEGHLPSALHLPFQSLPTEARRLPNGRDLLIYCRGPFCLMALEGTRQLREMAYPARRLRFSVPEWRLAGLPIERGSDGSQTHANRGAPSHEPPPGS